MFATQEESRYSGAPVDLYLFRYGPGVADYFAYTNAAQPVPFDDGSGIGLIEYQPIPIMRDSIKSSGTLDKAALKVSVPRNVGLADLFREYPPSYVVTLTIRQGHLTDPDAEYLVAWAGRVLGYARQGESVAEMTCEPVSTTNRRPGLREHYQYLCPYIVYSAQCRADQPARTVTGVVTAIDGLSVTLADGWAAVDIAKYRQGVARWTTAEGRQEIRQVLGVTAPNTLRLNAILRGLEAGMEISVSAGCNHRHTGVGGEGDCVNLHDNGPNFGGCRWIPTKNPIGSNNRFY